MKKILLICILLVLTGCLRVHKTDIEQGNVLTQDMVSRLHIGMNEIQVKNILGNPVLMNTFASNRLEYVYTFKPAYGNEVEKRVVLSFRGGVLQNIESNVH